VLVASLSLYIVTAPLGGFY